MKYFQLIYKVGDRCLTVSQDLYTSRDLADEHRTEFENRVMQEHPLAATHSGKGEIIELTVKG